MNDIEKAKAILVSGYESASKAVDILEKLEATFTAAELRAILRARGEAAPVSANKRRLSLHIFGLRRSITHIANYRSI